VNPEEIAMAAALDVPVHLDARESLRVTDGQGLEVRCIAGNLWVTQDRDARDVVFRAGESFALDRPGLALITALLQPAAAVVEHAGLAKRSPSKRDQAPCREPQLTHSLQLPRGDLVTVRPVCAEDAEEVQAYVRRLSNGSRYDRFLGALNELPSSEVERVTHWHLPREIALVAETLIGGARVAIGEARFAIEQDGLMAEFGVSVADSWRGRGLGTALMADIQCRLRELGVRYLVGEILRSNEPMQKLARKAGFRVTANRDPHLVRVVKDISARPARPCEELGTGVAIAA
jgi:RimJ/RimL family protein N-acetyltransferase